jgi:hypothetical protein
VAGTMIWFDILGIVCGTILFVIFLMEYLRRDIRDREERRAHRRWGGNLPRK